MNVLKKFQDKFSQLSSSQSLRSRAGQAIDSFKSKFFGFLKADLKRISLLMGISLLIVIGLSLPSGQANAGVGDWLAGIVLDHVIFPVVYIIFWVLFYVAYVIAWIGASIISANLNPYIMTTVLTSDNIYKGWQIFRDIANLLYILILLLVALGTIFRSDTYNAKKMLPRLIIVAFLMNFSMMLTELVIDFGNIMMYGILRMMCPPNSTTCFQDFYSQMMQSIDYLYKEFTFLSFINVTRQGVVGMAIATIYTFVYGLTLIALGIFLLIRIAVLAVLVVISPLAFFGMVSPGLKRVSNEWWDKLLSYSLFGPVFALLLYVAGLMAMTTFTVNPGVTTTNPNLGAMTGLFATIISNIIPLVFLLAIVPITKSMGMMGAGMIMNNTVGLSAAVGGLAGGYIGSSLDRFAARGAQRTGNTGYDKFRRKLAYLSPGAMKRGWKAHKAEQEHDYDEAAGKWRGQISRTDNLSLKKSPVDFEQEAHERDVARAGKDIMTEDTKELIHQLNDALDSGLMIRAEAIARKIGTKGDSDELLEKSGYNVSPEGFKQYYEDKFKPKIGAKKTALLMSDIKELEAKDGNKSLKGITDYDETKKQTVVRDISTDEGKKGLVDAEVGAFYKDSASQAMSRLNKKTMLDRVKDLDKDGKEQYNEDGSIKYKWKMAENGRGGRIIEKMTEPYFDKIKNVKETEAEKIRDALAAQKEEIGGNWNNLTRLKTETNDPKGDSMFKERVAKYERFEEKLGERYKPKGQKGAESIQPAGGGKRTRRTGKGQRTLGSYEATAAGAAAGGGAGAKGESEEERARREEEEAEEEAEEGQP